MGIWCRRIDKKSILAYMFALTSLSTSLPCIVCCPRKRRRFESSCRHLRGRSEGRRCRLGNHLSVQCRSRGGHPTLACPKLYDKKTCSRLVRQPGRIIKSVAQSSISSLFTYQQTCSDQRIKDKQWKYKDIVVSDAHCHGLCDCRWGWKVARQWP